MLISNAKIYIFEDGDFQELSVTSCDVTYVNSSSRPKNKQSNYFTNKMIDELEINIPRGQSDSIDGSKLGDKFQFKFDDGAIKVTFYAYVSNKVTTSANNNIYLSLGPSYTDPISYEAHGGGGGTDDYEDLNNKPKINGETLIGDKNQKQLKLDQLPSGNLLPSGEYEGQLFILMEDVGSVGKGIYRFNSSSWNKIANVGADITAEQLADLMEGSEEVVVDLNEDGDKVQVSLHAKAVTITAPSTATEGVLDEEQLAALQESKNSYIIFNNEKYYLMDNQHTTGSLGYSHLGYENNLFISKNITVTISTRAWKLNTKTDTNADFIIEADINEDLTGTITTNNYAEEIEAFYNTNGYIPNIQLKVNYVDWDYFDIIPASTWFEISEGWGISMSFVSLDTANEKIPYGGFSFNIEMEFGYSGTTDGESIQGLNADGDVVVSLITDNEIEIEGFYVPELTKDHILEARDALVTENKTCIIESLRPSISHFYQVNSFETYTDGYKIFAKISNVGNVEYDYNEITDTVTTRLHRDNYTIQTTEPVSEATDGKLHIVVLDNEPTTEYNGYFYFIKE